MALTKRYSAQIVVPCTAEMKQAGVALADAEQLSAAEIWRQVCEAGLPIVTERYQRLGDRS